MKIFIQGRKDGYNVLYPKPTPSEFFQFASDIQRIDAQNNAQYYGKNFYGVAFNGIGCIFTKYILGYDEQRGFLGNISISVYIPNNQKMAGADLKALLDDLINTYCSIYISNYSFNNKQEDWFLFTSLANGYDTKLSNVSPDDVENYQQGKQDAAYLLYSSNDELQKYLSNPYQEEYKEYKQVYFIENSSQDLLNAIKHSPNANLTDKIDWENPFYRLREYHGKAKNGISIEIRANGKLRNNKDKIFKKDNVTLRYSKNKYFEDIKKDGKLTEPQIREYLKIDENAKKIDIVKEVELVPIPKDFRFDVKDHNGNRIENAKIDCKSNYSNKPKEITGNTITFLGEELKEEWTISGKKGDFSGELKFTPESLEGVLVLELKEHKKFKLRVLDSSKGDVLQGYQIKVNGRSKNVDREGNVELVGEELNNPQIIVSASGYEDGIAKIENNEIIAKLNKKRQYNIDAGEFGEKTTSCPGWSDSREGKDIDKKSIKPHKGYVFTKWELNDKEDTLVAQYEEKKNLFLSPIVIIGMVALLLVIGVSTWFLFPKDSPDNKESAITENIITNYVEGDELLLDTLNNYEIQWKQQKPKEKNTGILGMFGFGKKETDSTEYKTWKETDELIEKAMKMRSLIDSAEFKLVLDSSYFSENQESFKNVLQKVDSIKSSDSLQYKNVIDNIGDISSLSLSEITDKINEVINPSKDEKKEPESAMIEEHPKSEANKEEGKSENLEHKKEWKHTNEEEEQSKVPLNNDDETSNSIEENASQEASKENS